MKSAYLTPTLATAAAALAFLVAWEVAARAQSTTIGCGTNSDLNCVVTPPLQADGVDGPGLWQCDKDQPGPMICHRAAAQCAARTSHVADTQEERHKACEKEIDDRLSKLVGQLIIPEVRSAAIIHCEETAARLAAEKEHRAEASKRDAKRRDEMLRKFRTGK